jgi:hypothetical protein
MSVTQKSPPLDEQYDMIDDLSEISNDDHDTASIGSNDQEHNCYSPRIGSDVDESVASSVLGSFADLSDAQRPEPASSPRFIPSEVTQTNMNLPVSGSQIANDLIDSYSSEDLETPRQSTAETTFKSTWRQALHQSTIRHKQPSSASENEAQHRVHRILFVSDKAVHSEELETICTQVAAGLDTTGRRAAAHSIARLPETPSGVGSGTSAVVYDGARVSATIQHCVGAEERRDHSFQLQVQDSDGSFSHLFTVGNDGRTDLEAPDMVVFYVDQGIETLDPWFKTISDAIKKCKYPMLVVYGSNFTSGSYTTMPVLAEAFSSKAAVSIQELTRASQKNEVHRRTRNIISFQRLRKATKSRRANLLTAMLKPGYLSVVLLCLAFLIWPMTLQPIDTAAANTARRAALESVFAQESSAANFGNSYNLEHLLPQPPQGCTSVVVFGHELTQPACATDVRYQGLSPNHILISLPGQTRFPQIQMVHVDRNGGQHLKYNMTQLVDGVYCVSIEPKEAHGAVNLKMTTSRPHLLIELSHNFGSRILQLHAYQEVGTDVSKVVGKDLAVIRHAAQGITEWVTYEIGSGIATTYNITTEVARYATRDLQIVADNAVAVYDKAVATGNWTMAIITKDFVLVQQGLTRFANGVSTVVKAKVDAIKVRAATRRSLGKSRKTLKRLEKVLSHVGTASDDLETSGEKVGSEANTKAQAKDATPLHIQHASRAVDRAHRLLGALRKRLETAERKAAPSKQDRKEIKKLQKQIRAQQRDVTKLEMQMLVEQGHIGTPDEL